MNRIAAGLALFAVVTTACVSPISASQDTSLAKVASELGYAYGYLGPEDAVSLSRPGVTIVIRPGERLFDVNDRTEAMDGPAPHFYRNDVYVSSGLVGRLRAIAKRYPSLSSGATAIVLRNPSNGGAPVSGAISAFHVEQTPGQQTLSVSGKAPANIPITISLTGTFSSEIPDVLLSRQYITAEADGTFRTDVTIASGFFRGAVLTMAATSVTGVTPAKATIVLKPVNGKVSVPADETPKSIR